MTPALTFIFITPSFFYNVPHSKAIRRATPPPPRKPRRRSLCTHLSALVSEKLPGVVDDLLVRQVGVRLLLTDAQHLPQSDSEGPHVAGGGELTLETRRRTRIKTPKKRPLDGISLS